MSFIGRMEGTMRKSYGNKETFSSLTKKPSYASEQINQHQDSTNGSNHSFPAEVRVNHSPQTKRLSEEADELNTETSKALCQDQNEYTNNCTINISDDGK